MTTQREVIRILAEVLENGSGPGSLEGDTPLLGAMPDLDSMAVVAILTLIEERFGIEIEDDEIDASAFETVRTLVLFVEERAG